MEVHMRCFLIDDDTDDQEIFVWVLERINPAIRCDVASDGVEALEKLRTDEEFVPQFIFLDLNMPRMHGRQCLVELKKIQRLHSTPIIIYSTSSDPRDIAETKQLGATDYIVKPPRVSALTEMLTTVLRGGPTISV